MNNNLPELIEKLVYKTTDESGWAPQNKLGQYLARMGRSVKELGYDKMSSFFQDHPERFLVEKDEHGLPIVKLIGEPPVYNDEELETETSYQAPSYQRTYNNYFQRQNGYGEPNMRMNYNTGYQRYNNYGGFQRNMGGYRDRQPMGMNFRRSPEQLSLFRWAFFPDREEWLQMLADLSKEQVWQYEDSDPMHPNPALFDYLRDTFRRLQIEGRVLENRAEGIALFNTGLLDREGGRPIYAVFGPNPNRNRQPWLFQEFFLSSAPGMPSHNHAAQANDNQYDDTMVDDNDDYDVAPLSAGEEPDRY